MIKDTNNTNTNTNTNNNNPTKITTDITTATTTTTTTTTIAFCFLLSTTLFAFAAFAAFSSTSSSFSTTRLFSFSTATTTASLPPLCRTTTTIPDPNLNSTRTQPHHILFSLSGSATTWPDRRRYSELWWSPNHTRGFVYLDRVPDSDPNPGVGPTQRVSGSVGRWAKASDRIARLVKESFETGAGEREREVRWLVMGDDDTVFFPENLVAVLAKYDHRRMYYIGGNSESVEQDVMHGYGTAFGGGGFAVSYGLACELVGILDGCIDRYHQYYGSDEKVAACVGDLGVSLTKEPGFHQMDIRGDPYGFLAAHPVAPLVSLHHLDSVNPIFPGQTQVDSLKKLMQSYHVDPGLTLQQSFCYDRKRKWSVSIAWGYTAQLYPSLISSRLLTTPLQTFRTWRSSSNGPFVFNTRPFVDDPCERPIVYFLDQVQDVGKGKTLSTYKRVPVAGKCNQLAYKYAMSVDKFTVTAVKSSPDQWLKAPRRRCCEITNSWTLSNNMKVEIRSCKPRESMSI